MCIESARDIEIKAFHSESWAMATRREFRKRAANAQTATAKSATLTCTTNDSKVCILRLRIGRATTIVWQTRRSRKLSESRAMLSTRLEKSIKVSPCPGTHIRERQLIGNLSHRLVPRGCGL